MSELGPERIRFREGCPPPFCYVTQKNKREIYTRNILLWELKENGDRLDDVTCRNEFRRRFFPTPPPVPI